MGGPENKSSGMTRREFNKTVALFGVGALINLVFGRALPQPTSGLEIELPPDGDSAKRLLLLADVHIGNTNRSLLRQINTHAASQLQSTVNQMKDKYFDWVIQLGDLISEAGNENTNIKNYKKGLEIINHMHSPVINIPGNHDIWGIGTARLSQTLQELGYNMPLYGVKEISPNCQIVWLDLAAKKREIGVLPDERIDWLREVIHPDTPTIIFSHYGFLPPDTEGNYYYEKDREAATFSNGPQAWRYLRDLPIRAVVSAHLHEETFSIVGHTNMLTIPSFTENIASHIPAIPGVYSILEVTDSRLNLKSYCGKYCFSSMSL